MYFVPRTPILPIYVSDPVSVHWFFFLGGLGALGGEPPAVRSVGPSGLHG